MDQILTLADFEEAAKAKLSPAVYNFVEGGAHLEQTVRENVKAFKKYKLRPRYMRDVSQRTVKSSILGENVTFPIGVAPTSTHTFYHSQGEIASATAAQKAGVPFTISMRSSYSCEQIMKVCPGLLAFQQIIISRPRSLTEEVVKQAERNNVKALVVTMDRTIYPIRIRDTKFKMGIYDRIENHESSVDKAMKKLLKPGIKAADIVCHGSTTWQDIDWLKSITKLPIIAKGIQTAEDAREALSHGIAAIWLSNHGGRTLDCVSPTIDVLHEIVQVTEGQCEVYVDGGFRSGVDVYKALALGAQAVFIGRPVNYGLAVGGEAGVTKVLGILREELDNTMALTGCRNVREITKDHVTIQCQCCL